MLIFGASTKTHQLAMLNLLCSFCGNPAAHALRKRVTKFSLFFIPLFPIAPPKHQLQCTFCGAVSDVTKENAEQLLAQGGAQPGGPGHGHSGSAGQHPQESGRPPQNPYQS